MDDHDCNKKRQFFREFIRLYESFPCLWNVKSYQYHDREQRTKAYKVLSMKLQEIQSGADRLAVVKKINCFRSNLRKEKRKIQEGLKAGKIVKPKLWYHHYFDFLNGIGKKIQTKVVLEVEKDIDMQSTVSADPIKEENRPCDPLGFEYIMSESNRGQNCSEDADMAITEPCQPDYQEEHEKISHPTTSVTDSGHTSETGNYRTLEQDRHDVFGENVAMKLRHLSSMNDKQRIMAEKIINEALSLAEMGLLTMANSKVLT